MKNLFNKNLSINLTLITLFFIFVDFRFNNLTESISAPWQLYFQDPETPVMEGIINFHDKAMFLITFIVFSVGYILFRCVLLFQDKNDNRLSEKFIHGTLIEIIWTILPALVLLNLAVPSFSLLYSMEELPSPQGTLKCVGHQWYWTYEYSDNFTRADDYAIVTRSFERIPSNKLIYPTIFPESKVGDVNLLSDFDKIDENAALIANRWGWNSSNLNSLEKVTTFEESYTGKRTHFQEVETESYLINEAVDNEYYRLLSVDNSAKIPSKRHIRILVTSADVLHSWAVPSLGIKVDACPGRLNQTSTYLSRSGVKHYGQCSEICGVNHGFMPIVIESFDLNSEDYVDMVLENRHSIISY